VLGVTWCDAYVLRKRRLVKPAEAFATWAWQHEDNNPTGNGRVVNIDAVRAQGDGGIQHELAPLPAPIKREDGDGLQSYDSPDDIYTEIDDVKPPIDDKSDLSYSPPEEPLPPPPPSPPIDRKQTEAPQSPQSILSNKQTNTNRRTNKGQVSSEHLMYKVDMVLCDNVYNY
jgi:hypothetical protein